MGCPIALAIGPCCEVGSDMVHYNGKDYRMSEGLVQKVWNFDDCGDMAPFKLVLEDGVAYAESLEERNGIPPKVRSTTFSEATTRGYVVRNKRGPIARTASRARRGGFVPRELPVLPETS